jgi:hypothetical protein
MVVMVILHHNQQAVRICLRSGKLSNIDQLRMGDQKYNLELNNVNFWSHENPHMSREPVVSLVWYPGKGKRIAPLSFLHGCRKRRFIHINYNNKD